MAAVQASAPPNRSFAAMRIGIIALLQESNTFITGATTLAHFEADMLLEGEPVRARFDGAHHEVGGFFAGLAEEHIDAVPIFAARALPVSAWGMSEDERGLQGFAPCGRRLWRPWTPHSSSDENARMPAS